jgi:acetoin:2,6-dichlorophenolindophenol oxidoreductase subunit alpha
MIKNLTSRVGATRPDQAATKGETPQPERMSSSALDLESLPQGSALELLEQMYLLRAFDERVSELCRRKKLPGLIHLGVGEEAVAVGTCAALKPNDKVTSTHRAHGHFLAKGGDPGAFMAELYGKITGCCRGKGGSMHLTDLDVGFLGANGVVGAGLPIAVGSALGQRILGQDFVTVCFFGDGANNQGTFHESLNLAAVWDLPIVFVCENNEYGISLNVRDQQKLEHVADRAASYGMPGRIVDGNNVVAVLKSVSEAVDAARNGQGPALIECKTYRTIGHYEGDSQSYRPKEEIEAWRRKDPIVRMEVALKDASLASDDDFVRLRAKIEKLCDEAQAFAEASEFPPPEAALQDVFAPDTFHVSRLPVLA